MLGHSGWIAFGIVVGTSEVRKTVDVPLPGMTMMHEIMAKKYVVISTNR